MESSKLMLSRTSIACYVFCSMILTSGCSGSNSNEQIDIEAVDVIVVQEDAKLEIGTIGQIELSTEQELSESVGSVELSVQGNLYEVDSSLVQMIPVNDRLYQIPSSTRAILFNQERTGIAVIYDFASFGATSENLEVRIVDENGVDGFVQVLAGAKPSSSDVHELRLLGTVLFSAGGDVIATSDNFMYQFRISPSQIFIADHTVLDVFASIADNILIYDSITGKTQTIVLPHDDKIGGGIFYKEGCWTIGEHLVLVRGTQVNAIHLDSYELRTQDISSFFAAGDAIAVENITPNTEGLELQLSVFSKKEPPPRKEQIVIQLLD